MLSRIRLELARTHEKPSGDASHGYEFVAPLGRDGHIDPAEWKKARPRCTVTHFAPGREDMQGHLIHTKGRRWAFHYDASREPEDDEPGWRFDSHVFRVGEYVSVTEHDGVTRPFKVIAVKNA